MKEIKAVHFPHCPMCEAQMQYGESSHEHRCPACGHACLTERYKRTRRGTILMMIPLGIVFVFLFGFGLPAIEKHAALNNMTKKFGSVEWYADIINRVSPNGGKMENWFDLRILRDEGGVRQAVVFSYTVQGDTGTAAYQTISGEFGDPAAVAAQILDAGGTEEALPPAYCVHIGRETNVPYRA